MILLVVLIGGYMLLMHFFGPNLLVESTGGPAQVLIRPLEDGESVKTVSELRRHSRYTLLGETPIQYRIESGGYVLLFKRSGAIPVTRIVHRDSGFQEITVSLVQGYRHVPSKTVNHRGNRISVGEFFLSEAEVTNREYLIFCNETGYRKPLYADDPTLNQPNQPVIGVNFEDVQTFLKWKSETTGYHFRLPTEVEWEYAATGGDTSFVYPWGRSERMQNRYLANYHPFDFVQRRLLPRDVDGFDKTAPVRSFPRTNRRFYDMAGNAFEWCGDTIRDKKNYPDLTLSAELLPDVRIVKGGSWNFNQLMMQVKRRVFVDGRIRKGNTGIRPLIVADF